MSTQFFSRGLCLITALSDPRIPFLTKLLSGHCRGLSSQISPPIILNKALNKHQVLTKKLPKIPHSTIIDPLNPERLPSSVVSPIIIFVPSCNTAISCEFGDLWSFGNFVSIEAILRGGPILFNKNEERTAYLGLWQCCFTRGSAGELRKCRGGMLD